VDSQSSQIACGFVRLVAEVDQRRKNIVLTGCSGKYASIYIDNILVFSSTPEQHLQHLEDIFNPLDCYLHACYLHVIKVLPHNQRQPMLSFNRYIYLLSALL
jgi:hypothetical protein